MKISAKVALITIVFAAVTFFTGPLLWPAAHEIPTPTAFQLPFFIFLAIAESVTFGLGISFILLGWPWIKSFQQSKSLATATFIAIAWMLVSWWPHDTLHMATGLNLQSLLYIEYGFHFTLMVAGLIVAYHFWKLIPRPLKRETS